MYFAIISMRYDPNAITEPKESKGSCFSRWKFEKDWTLSIKAMTNSVSYGTGTGYQAIDGIYTQNNQFGFVTLPWGGEALNPWLLVELDKAKVIKTLLAIGRSSQHHFKNILIEIVMCVDSLKKFAVYGPVEAPYNEVIEITGKPTKGKFIKFSKTNEIYLCITELAILGI